MHEASLMRDLMRKVDTLADAEGAKKVLGIRIWLGALSHMSAEHFREHFAQSASGTLAEDAVLEIEESSDTSHPNAQDLLLLSIEVDT